MGGDWTTGSFWDRVAGLYDLGELLNRRVNRQAVRQVAQLVPPGAAVLDCAAGTGAFSLAAAGRAGSVLAADLSRSMLERAAAKAKRAGVDNITFAVRDVADLPEADGSFDVVIAANVLHLLAQPERAVRELWRVTRVGGRLILPTYLQGKTGAAAGAVIKIYQGVGFHYEHAFTPQTYRAFLEGLGLGLVTLEVIEGRVPEGIAVLERGEGA